MHSIFIGSEHHFLRLDYAAPLDNKWLGRFRAEVRDGMFSGEATCWDNPDVNSGIFGFRDQLEQMNQTLKGKAVFEPLEEQLVFKMRVDSLGSINVDGRLFSQATYGTSLTFEFGIDQTYLPGIISQLKQLGA